ncbi:MAG TPA: hypothetical protein VIN10_07810 [Bacteroidales bacterium]
MKKSPFLIAICLMLTSFSVIPIFSQDVETKQFNNKKTEVNIAVANIFAKNNWLFPYYYFDGSDFIYDYYYEYIPQPELQVGVKLHNDKGAFRLATNFQYFNNTYENTSGSTNKSKINNLGFQLNLGYEWELTYNRIVIYYGADLSTAINSRMLSQENYNSTNDSKYNELGLGINPLLGVNCFITPNLSVGTEVKFTAEYISGKSTYTSSESSSTNENKNSGFRTYFGPLGFLSVNIYF